MPFSIQCPGCGQRLKAPDGLAGRRLPCPKCKHELQVPDRPVEDEAAALLLEDDPDAPAPPPPPTYSPPAPIPAVRPRPGPVAPPKPVAELPPLTTNEPPLWLRHLHWLLVLALIPLAVTLLRKGGDDDILTRLDESIEAAPPDAQERAVRALVDEKSDLDDVLAALPRQRLIGAALARNTYWHWAFAALAAGVFLGFCALLATGGVADPRHLLAVGLFTGTVGILVLLVFQALAGWSQGVWPHGRGLLTIVLYLFKLIGLSYRAALDPDNGFWVSFLGFTAGVGLCEELCKAVPVLWHQRRTPDEGWRGAFLWGLASGAGFGIAEGVIYAGNYYNGVTGPGSYVVRFVSCVALHAVWTGSVAIAVQQRQEWLQKAERWADLVAPVLVYIAVPMLLHGLYDTLLKKDMNGGALVVAIASFGYLAFRIGRLHGADDATATAAMLREYRRRRKAQA
jgi:RsiW-degrading membrane proteinase PrsW (M82 family)